MNIKSQGEKQTDGSLDVQSQDDILHVSMQCTWATLET